MELVNRTEAAKRAYVSTAMISIWIRKGRVQKYPNPHPQTIKGQYLVDLDEVKIAYNLKEWALQKLDNPNLISIADAAEEFNVSIGTIHRWVEVYGVTKFHVPTSTRQFFVDREEIHTLQENLLK
jgi:transposase